MNAEYNLTIGGYTANMSKWGKVQKHIWALIPLNHRIVMQILLLLSMSDYDTSSWSIRRF